MITPERLADELNLLQIHKELQESILRDIARRLVKTDFSVTDTAAWQAEKLQQSGMLYKEIVTEIAKRTKKSDEEITAAFEDVKTEVFEFDESDAPPELPKEFKAMSPAMKAVMTAALKKTKTEVRNLTGTTAVTSQNSFIRACDLAHQQIVSGAFSYGEAIKNAIKSAAKDGVTVVYPSGYISSLDAAVRRAVLTGTAQTTGKLVEMRAKESKEDLMQLSAHSGARPDHAEWQGKIVSLSGRKGYLTLEDIGYGEVTGFLGANCRHTWFIFYEGYTKPAYTEEQLEAFRNETVTYDGEVIPIRQALDRQRNMERSIRRSKQQLVMFDEAMKNAIEPEEKILWEQEFNNAAVKLKSKEAKLKDFCEKTTLKRDRNREQVFAAETENGIKAWGKSVSQKAVQANKIELTKLENKRIIKEIKLCGLKGEINLKPKAVDLSDYSFDNYHMNKERSHNITRKDAESFVKNAKITETTWKGKFVKYISQTGATYLNVEEKSIRTAFFREEFGKKFERALEVLKRYGR